MGSKATSHKQPEMKKNDLPTINQTVLLGSGHYLRQGGAVEKGGTQNCGASSWRGGKNLVHIFRGGAKFYFIDI